MGNGMDHGELTPLYETKITFLTQFTQHLFIGTKTPLFANKCYTFQLLCQKQTKTLISHLCISNMKVRSHELQQCIYVHYYFFFSTAVTLVHLLHYIIQWQNHINFIQFYRIFL